jgi:hypothetical protein
MKRFSFSRVLVLMGTLALAITGQANATTTTTGGPYLDFKGYLGTDTVNQGTSITTQTTVWHTELLGPPTSWIITVNPYNGQAPAVYSWPEGVTDHVWIVQNNNLPPLVSERQMVGASYLTYDTSSGTADMVFTTIYGIDSNPASANSLAMTGYNMTTPDFTLSGESVAGADGLVYNASVSQFTQISNLSSLLGTGFDLTPFQGDPTAGVYVFQTTIPQSAMSIVPEPSTFVLLAVGAIGLLGCAWRRRMSA